MFKCLTIVLCIIVWFVLYSYAWIYSVTHINYCLSVINPELVWLQCWCSSKFLCMWYDDVVIRLRFDYAFVMLWLCLCYAYVMILVCLSYGSVMLQLCLCYASVTILLWFCYASIMILLCFCHWFIVPLLCFHWNEILTQYFSKFFSIHIFLKTNT